MEYEIRITMKNGQLTVTAPFEQRALCYGMLEMARDIVQQQSGALQEQRVIPARQIAGL